MGKASSAKRSRSEALRRPWSVRYRGQGAFPDGAARLAWWRSQHPISHPFSEYLPVRPMTRGEAAAELTRRIDLEDARG